MKILHVIQTLDPATGGPPVVAASLAVAQHGLGHQVTLVSYPEQASAMDDASVPGISAVRRVDLPRRGLVERLTARRAGKHIDREVETADVVHLHNVWEPLLLRAATSARRHDKPYLLLPNGMLDPWSLRQSALKKRVAMAIATRRMLNRAAALHILNHTEATLIEPLGLHSRAVVIPNGIWPLPDDQVPANGTFRASVPGLGDRPFILFLSRLHYKKGLDILADAFAEAAGRSQAHLVVAGPDGGARDGFERQIAAAGLGDRVHVVGPLYGDRKWAALKDADLWALPSRQEGFSIAVLEAMSFGKAIVISEDCHFPEVAQEEAGLVLPLNAGRFAGAFVDLMADPAARQRYGERARALVLERFTWPKVAEQTISVYQSLKSG